MGYYVVEGAAQGAEATEASQTNFPSRGRSSPACFSIEAASASGWPGSPGRTEKCLTVSRVGEPPTRAQVVPQPR